ncbi:MAG: class II aldolase/adducin family protein [Chloroflexi bacterium OLB15]|nr:MAG: class II aldolase/adducin family protein [Chloroflexi bacterium OLB15]
MNAKEQALREEICLIGRLMHQKQYIDGSAGNISARLDDNRILSTPSGLAKGFMSPDQLIIVDMDANRIDEPNDANRHLVPTSEVLMHLECYRQREDVQGVVHAHPQTAVALTLVGYDFRRCIIPETVIILGMVPTTPYATPASAENRDAIRNLIAEHDAIMLAHHGSLTVAGSVWDAYLRLETLEHSAKTLFMAAQLGGPRELPAHQVQKLLGAAPPARAGAPGRPGAFC